MIEKEMDVGLAEALNASRRARLREDDWPQCPRLSWSRVPAGWKTRNQWLEDFRKVKPRQSPAAIVEWNKEGWLEIRSDGDDRPAARIRQSHPRTAHLYSQDQTTPIQPKQATKAAHCFYQLVTHGADRSKYLWHNGAGWKECKGRLGPDKIKRHIAGKDAYGAIGGRETLLGLIDHDLHDGDEGVFLDQLKVLLKEFHGRDGWHFQVAQENARGVHLFQIFFDPVPLAEYRSRLRARLRRLDEKYPELAERARKAGMRTLGELEVYPDCKYGYRLPLCKGRTMLLDKPLRLVYDGRRKDYVPDVERYLLWARRPCGYMPAEEVYNYIEERLASPGTRKSQPRPGGGSSGVTALGPLKGRFAQVLTDFWAGKCNPPDSLNSAIRLLSLVLPFYLSSEREAASLIEQFIDELPDTSFSDRLKAGDRKEVSRIVKYTVRLAYSGFAGQDDPKTSKSKLMKTVEAWKKRGFDPTDKSTWNFTATKKQVLASFTWTPKEIPKLAALAHFMKADLDAVSKAVKHFVCFVKSHPGECSIEFVRRMLEGLGISCGHHGKVNHFLQILRDWEWVYVRAAECVFTRRARAYGVGNEMMHKFNNASLSPCSSLSNVSKSEPQSLPPASILFASHRTLRSDLNNRQWLPGLLEKNKGSPQVELKMSFCGDNEPCLACERMEGWRRYAPISKS